MQENYGKVQLSSVASMSEEQEWGFLEQNNTVVISTVHPNGTIFSSPVWYTVRDEGLHIALDQASYHVKNVEHGSGVTAIVEAGGDDLCTSRGIQLRGDAEPVTDPEENEACVEQILDEIFGPDHPHEEAYRKYRDYYDNSHVRFEPERMISWDMRKLYNFQLYESGTIEEAN